MNLTPGEQAYYSVGVAFALLFLMLDDSSDLVIYLLCAIVVFAWPLVFVLAPFVKSRHYGRCEKP